MGVRMPEQDEELKEELATLRDGLTGEEQHKLKMIRQNLEEKGSGGHIISFRSARDMACKRITEASISVDPVVREGAKAAGCKLIRDLVLNNPVFDEYV